MVGTKILHRDQRKRHPKGYTSHEVTAPRAVGPSGRTYLLFSSKRTYRLPRSVFPFPLPIGRGGLDARAEEFSEQPEAIACEGDRLREGASKPERRMRAELWWCRAESFAGATDDYE